MYFVLDYFRQGGYLSDELETEYQVLKTIMENQNVFGVFTDIQTELRDEVHYTFSQNEPFWKTIVKIDIRDGFVLSLYYIRQRRTRDASW